MQKLTLGISIGLFLGFGFMAVAFQPSTTNIEAPLDVPYPVIQLHRVIDGDTFEAWVKIAPRLAYFADIRVDGADTPEVRGECKTEGDRVTELVTNYLFSASEIQVLVTGETFGRWAALVNVDGVDLGEWIVEQGLTKEALCEL